MTIVDISRTGETVTVASSNQTKLEWVYKVSTTVSYTVLFSISCYNHMTPGSLSASISSAV